MTDEDPRVPIVCPDCETTTEIPLSEVADSVEQHNQRLHGGEEVAQVDPAIADQLADIVAEDLNLV
jgi:hypothetical protein